MGKAKKNISGTFHQAKTLKWLGVFVNQQMITLIIVSILYLHQMCISVSGAKDWCASIARVEGRRGPAVVQVV